MSIPVKEIRIPTLQKLFPTGIPEVRAKLDGEGAQKVEELQQVFNTLSSRVDQMLMDEDRTGLNDGKVQKEEIDWIKQQLQTTTSKLLFDEEIASFNAFLDLLFTDFSANPIQASRGNTEFEEAQWTRPKSIPLETEEGSPWISEAHLNETAKRAAGTNEGNTNENGPDRLDLSDLELAIKKYPKWSTPEDQKNFKEIIAKYFPFVLERKATKEIESIPVAQTAQVDVSLQREKSFEVRQVSKHRTAKHMPERHIADGQELPIGYVWKAEGVVTEKIKNKCLTLTGAPGDRIWAQGRDDKGNLQEVQVFTFPDREGETKSTVEVPISILFPSGTKQRDVLLRFTRLHPETDTDESKVLGPYVPRVLNNDIVIQLPGEKSIRAKISPPESSKAF